MVVSSAGAVANARKENQKRKEHRSSSKPPGERNHLERAISGRDLGGSHAASVVWDLEHNPRRSNSKTDADVAPERKASIATISSEVSDAVSVGLRPTEASSSDRKSRNSVMSARSKPDNLWYQGKVRKWYDQAKVQIAVAALIFGNFIVSAINAQFHLEGTVAIAVFELFFNVCFTIELVVNMYGSWCCEFWSSLWNVFDFVIVWISLISMILKDLPGISVLRLFRAFRVFRLFKRIKNLRIIIEGCLKSLPGVCNAFFVLSLIMSIWAIMAVDFFREDRPVEFGNFVKAVVTFFQMMTYDSWASAVARPLILEKGAWVSIIFISYVFVNAVMMTNVVVAVLLEKFIDAMESRKASDKREAAQKALEEALEARELGKGTLASIEIALENLEDEYYGEDMKQELQDLVADAKFVLEEEKAEPCKSARHSLADDHDHVTDLPDFAEPESQEDDSRHSALVTFGAIEYEPSEKLPDNPWKAQSAKFQADFVRELRWMLSELDGLEQDISLLEGSTPLQETQSEEIVRIDEGRTDLSGEAAPHMDGPRHFSESSALG